MGKPGNTKPAKKASEEKPPPWGTSMDGPVKPGTAKPKKVIRATRESKERLGDPDYGGFTSKNNPIAPSPSKPKKTPTKSRTAAAPSPSPSPVKAKKPIKHALPPGLVVPVLPLVARMPKVELHVHFDGAFDTSLVFAEAKALQARGELIGLPEEVDIFGETLRVRDAVANCGCSADFETLASCKGKRSLHAMFQCFECFLPVVRGRLVLLEQLAFRFVEAQAAQSVLYTEVRYSPQLLADGGVLQEQKNGKKMTVQQGCSAEDVYQAVTRGLRRGEGTYGVVCNQILCCLGFRPDWSTEVVEMADQHRHDAPCQVVGVDIAGGEEWFGLKADGPTGMHGLHAAALRLAQQKKLKITLHAGENTSAANVEAAVFEHGATRIGHGYRLLEDPKLMARIQNLATAPEPKLVHFECCPTSSYETGAWVGPAAETLKWEQHPAKALLDAGCSISLNSDDPSVFASSLTSELALGGTNGGMGLQIGALARCTLNAANAAFIDDKEKSALASRLKAQFKALGINPSPPPSASAAPVLFKVILTGGPCGGKTSILDVLSKEFKQQGFDVYCLPEVPTVLIQGGCGFPGLDGGDKLVEFETGLIELQMQLEDSFFKIAASTGRPSICFLDRGLLDIPAYLPPKQWQDVLDATGFKEADMAERYDLVLHLVTAANGAEAFYTNANNTARRETAEEARDLDSRILKNWARVHPHVAVLDNSSDFDGKCQRTMEAVRTGLNAAAAATTS